MKVFYQVIVQQTISKLQIELTDSLSRKKRKRKRKHTEFKLEEF